MWTFATALLATLAIQRFKKNAPPPLPPPPLPLPPPDPLLTTTVFTNDEKIIDISTASVGPFQKHGDWFWRHLTKNKIGIKNETNNIFKILYKPHPLLNGISLKECTANFNVEYEWESDKIFPQQYKKIHLDTHRCDIKIFQDTKLVFKQLCSSSRNIKIQTVEKSARGMGCFGNIL